ncbi:hypothetical protein SAMN04488074_117108 [Lentzea albidocapillata subsp. violacea]|uniref:Uncharacterized protein n=1 Tax=Lentzea albidocapillata subsp. violacea TaxID=128104 RepID=A0A1G9QYF6_9PSEU|nr:hypothetical protein [Lentzea albidocapillata]SDM16039.1 hypothetical protein SAMN04488074_117108 [Lentzea albidocapillata subsp. violacea]
MSTVEAGWALIGKTPGSYEDYAVLAASRDPFTPRTIRQFVVERGPGNPPSVQETGPGAMPWAWFFALGVDDVSYVCLSISEWSNDLDATNRPIVSTRFFCLRTDDLLASRLSYSDFYRAALRVPLHAGLPDAPVRLVVEPASPQPPVLSDGHAIAAAGAVFDRQVGLIGGPLSLDARIAVLDEVMAFLPAGAKAWLTAGGWTDFATSYPLRLGFAAQARDPSLGVDLRGTAPQVQGAYASALRELVASHGADAVRAHLATLTQSREWGAAEAVVALRDLDQEHALLKAAFDGTLRPVMLRRLGAARFRRMSESDRETVLATYLEFAAADDLRLDRAVLAENWRPRLGKGFEDLVRQRLHRGTWSAGHLLGAAEFAAEVDARESFANVLRWWAGERRSASLGALVTALARDAGWSASLAPVIAHSDQLAVAVMRAALPDGAGVSNALLALLHADYPNSSWERYGRPYLHPRHIEEQHLGALNEIDPDAVADVMRNARLGAEPGWWSQLLGWFLDLVRRCRVISQSWIELLRNGLEPMEPSERARVDVALCLRGQAPGQDLGRAGATYWTGLVEAARASFADDQQRRQCGDALAVWLGHAWGNESGRFFEIMAALWQLSDALGGQEVLTPALMRSIAEQVRRAPQRLEDVRLNAWLPRFEVDPELHSLVLMAQLRGLQQDRAAAYVAVLVAKILHGKIVSANDVVEVLSHRWSTSPHGWAEFLSVLNIRLAGMGDDRGPELCTKFVHALMRGDFGEQTRREVTQFLPRFMMQQGYLTVEICREAFRVQQVAGSGDELSKLLEQLVRRIREIMPKGWLGRMFRSGDGHRDHR